MKKAILILEDGTIFRGKGHGQSGVFTGELVFTTANPGYVKSLTDPSFAGQILVFAQPLIGNYGANAMWGESQTVSLSGAVVRRLSDSYFHREAQINLEEYLVEQGVGMISEVDTRQIVKIIRDRGCLKSALAVYEEHQENETLSQANTAFREMKSEDYVKKTSTKEIYTVNEKGSKTVALIDYGMKASIVKELEKRDAKVVVFPPDTSADIILSYNPDGVMLSNGPGDPADVTYTFPTLKKLMEKEVNIFGICLGHQLISIASGAKTYKMRFGNRGANQPVQDVETKKAYITSQNHGYAVDESTLQDGWKVWMKNLNDGSIEGIKHSTKPFRSVQFHPEANPGPWDTTFLFDDFLNSL